MLPSASQRGRLFRALQTSRHIRGGCVRRTDAHGVVGIRGGTVVELFVGKYVRRRREPVPDSLGFLRRTADEDSRFTEVSLLDCRDRLISNPLAEPDDRKMCGIVRVGRLPIAIGYC